MPDPFPLPDPPADAPTAPTAPHHTERYPSDAPTLPALPVGEVLGRFRLEQGAIFRQVGDCLAVGLAVRNQLF